MGQQHDKRVGIGSRSPVNQSRCSFDIAVAKFKQPIFRKQIGIRLFARRAFVESGSRLVQLSKRHVRTGLEERAWSGLELVRQSKRVAVATTQYVGFGPQDENLVALFHFGRQPVQLRGCADAVREVDQNANKCDAPVMARRVIAQAGEKRYPRGLIIIFDDGRVRGSEMLFG